MTASHRAVIVRAPQGDAGLDERGSSPVEFVLVGALLTFLTLGVLQLGLAVYVRNVAHDAAVEGAYRASLADTDDAEGLELARSIVARTVGGGVVHDAVAERVDIGYPAVSVTLTVTVPLVGLAGVPGGWEVTGHAPVQEID